MNNVPTKFLGVVAFAATVLFSHEAIACSCRYISVAEAFNRSQAVFLGRVIKIEKKLPHERFSEKIATVIVLKTWKGSSPDTVQVHTGSGFGDCGVLFKSGEEYAIFCTAKQSELRTTICDRTKLASQATKDIVELSIISAPK